MDILEVARVERELQRDPEGFRAQLFTSREIAYCDARRHPARHFAARFAAKEALFKALAVERLDMGAYREVEVCRHRGAPGIHLVSRMHDLAERHGARRILLTLTHTRDLAAAVVILESMSDGAAATGRG